MMVCWCGEDTRVLETRTVHNGARLSRRRECTRGHRFTSAEIRPSDPVEDTPGVLAEGYLL